MTVLLAFYAAFLLAGLLLLLRCLGGLPCLDPRVPVPACIVCNTVLK